ncbi:unnamed protein product [Linum trigynum]|uniref:RNase H type-1 domain-containing protein n=1 Tax=Linum trigynum TaxID=586398 RepID=A0AAV2FES2_9ROSI
MWDDATKSESHSTGGMNIMDQRGMILLAKGVQFSDIYNPMVVELLVLQEAAFWCLAHVYMETSFEGDANKINRSDIRDNWSGAILEEVVHYFALHSRLNVRFVGRNSTDYVSFL